MHQQLHVIRDTVHRPSTQASYTASRVRLKRKICCAATQIAATQIAATLTISFPRWRHMSLTSYWGQQRMSLTSYPGQVWLWKGLNTAKYRLIRPGIYLIPSSHSPVQSCPVHPEFVNWSLSTNWPEHFDHDILTMPFCPRHIVHDLLSVTFCPRHFVHYILSTHILFATFCLWHFVRWHFVRPPGSQVLPVIICKVTQFKTRYNFICRIGAGIGYTEWRLSKWQFL